MLTVHRDSGAIVRAIYSPTFTGQRPFVRLVGNPSEYAFDGEGFCKVLYHLQEEIDTIHNQRLDRMSQVNSLMTVTQSGSGLDDFKIKPGKNYVCDGNVQDVFREIKFSDSYPSTFSEEQMLVGLADRVTGNTAVVQGASTAERPVFKDSQLQLGESNKKFKSMGDNLIAGITEIMYQLLELYSQYDPRIQYQIEEGGKMVDKSITLPIMQIRDGLEITMAASSEIVSQEARREINNNLYMLISDAGTKMATVMQALTSPQVPIQFKKFLLATSKVNSKFLRDILLDSERPDAEALSLDIENILSPEEIQAMLQPPPPPMPPPMTGQPQGARAIPGQGGPGVEPPVGTPNGGMPPGGGPPNVPNGPQMSQ
jgi:hypothetical protein